MNGKPTLVVYDPYNDNQINGIIKQLEKSVGVGNFEVIHLNDFDEYEFEEEKDDDFKQINMEMERIKKIYNDWTPERRDQEFLKLSKSKNKDDGKNYILLLEVIFYEDLISEKEVYTYVNAFKAEMSLNIISNENSYELLGIDKSVKVNFEILEDFNAVDFLTQNKKHRLKSIKKFEKAYGDIPFVFFLKLIDVKDEPELLEKTCFKYYSLYPEYPLIKYFYLLLKSHDENRFKEYKIKKIFNNRKEITENEMFFFQFIKFIFLIRSEDNQFSLLEAMYFVIGELDLDEDKLEYFIFLIYMSKNLMVSEYLLNLEKIK